MKRMIVSDLLSSAVSHKLPVVNSFLVLFEFLSEVLVKREALCLALDLKTVCVYACNMRPCSLSENILSLVDLLLPFAVLKFPVA